MQYSFCVNRFHEVCASANLSELAASCGIYIGMCICAQDLSGRRNSLHFIIFITKLDFHVVCEWCANSDVAAAAAAGRLCCLGVANVRLIAFSLAIINWLADCSSVIKKIARTRVSSITALAYALYTKRPEHAGRRFTCETWMIVNRYAKKKCPMDSNSEPGERCDCYLVREQGRSNPTLCFEWKHHSWGESLISKALDEE